MRKMSAKSGVAEVVGTILILGMTVALFAAIILWVSTMPTPKASIRLDMDGQLTPIYKPDGSWNGVNITIQHRGGEVLPGFRTQVLFIVETPSGTLKTALLKTRGTEAGLRYGIDGIDLDWDTGEKWYYTNYSVLATEKVSVTVVDSIRSLVLWSEPLKGPTGAHPPLILEKWADRLPETSTIDVPLTGKTFVLYARVTDQDGDLIKSSVYVYLAFLYGTPEHKSPQRMYDDGTNGDLVANDGVFTGAYSFLKPSALSWDGGIILLNATDLQSHKTTSRMTLEVQEGPAGSTTKKPTNPGSGRPPNLNYNGLQGYNIFNATEWDGEGFNATETRTFRENEEVVVVIGSVFLKDTFGRNDFIMYDPYSYLPLDPVVYGTDKTLRASSKPSSTQAFEFFMFSNGYTLFITRFELNNASSVGINFHKTPSRPPQYYFARYVVEMEILDFLGNRFHTTDMINITANDNTILDYPKLETFKDRQYTTPCNTFNFTDMVYARLVMKDVDASLVKVKMGNVILQDFVGGNQVMRAPKSGNQVNSPVCHPNGGDCSTGDVFEINGPTKSYRFAVNLSRADQDPWVPGAQHYALRIASIIDSNEEYTLALSRQLTIRSPLYKLDVAIANEDTSDKAWGTHDQGYYFDNINAWDVWTKVRVHVGQPPPAKEEGRAIKYLDFDQDGDLDIVFFVKVDNSNAWLILYRRDLDTSGNTVWTRINLHNTGSVIVNDIATGSLNKDEAPEIVVGMADGVVRYYRNDGSWTTILVEDLPQAVTSVDLGDFDGDGDLDIVVGTTGKIKYYPNIDGLGSFTTTSITDQWYAEAENIQKGTIDSGSYSNTFANDDSFEVLKEAQITMTASYQNRTATSDYQTSYGSITSGSYADTQTQNDVAEVLTEGPGSNPNRRQLTHKWTMNLPASGTKTFYLDAYRNAGADDTFTFAYSADDATYTTLVTVTATSDSDSYLTASIASAVTGTVYIRVIDSQQSSGEVTDSVYVDHMYVETYYAPGTTSALEHYWRIQPLPSRPASTFTFYLRAFRSDPGTEGDNFQFAFSISGQYGAYTDMAGTLVNQASEALYSSGLPTTVSGQTVWIRVVDVDRTVGRTQLATCTVDQMYIEVVTTGGMTGSEIALPDGAVANAVDVGNQNGDKYDDVVVGSAGSHVYKMLGGSGGLQSPSGIFYTTAAAVIGVKFLDAQTGNGLEIAAATGSTVYILRASAAAGLLLSSITSTNTITAFTAGDVNGDELDDIVFGTGGTNIGYIKYYKNRGTGTAWVTPDPIPAGMDIGVKIWDIDLGDAGNSQYRGR